MDIKQHIQSLDHKAISIFFTAGFPYLNDTTTIFNSLEANGVDLIEVGIPYSDPLADGPTIQQSSEKALANGMNLTLLFEQLATIKGKTHIPIVLMGYFNPVLQFGIENFCAACKDSGVSGVILPDLPLDLFKRSYQKTFEQYGIANVCLITPQTSPERIAEIDSVSNAFIYAVSSSSTTGKHSGGTDSYLERLSQFKLNNPVLTGFNIRDKESFDKATEHTAGGIIGSAFIKAIENSTNLKKDIESFISTLRN